MGGRCGFSPRGSLSPGAGVMLGAPVVGDWRRTVANEKVHRMLVLTRKSNQSIMIGDEIEVSVLSVMGEKVRIGIQAPQHVPVFRKEIYLEIHREAGAVAAQNDGSSEEGDAGAAAPDTEGVDESLRELGEGGQ